MLHSINFRTSERGHKLVCQTLNLAKIFFKINDDRKKKKPAQTNHRKNNSHNSDKKKDFSSLSCLMMYISFFSNTLIP